MDFHSLMRRDLQFLCKKNKIPANMTNVAMADALKSLEIVEGLEEYMAQFEQSSISVAKQPSKTATRTTRRTTTRKAEAQPSSRSVSLSTNKSLAEELDEESITQEPKTNSVKFEANVPKTSAARSTRKASAATSCTKKEEMDQENIKKTVNQEPKTNSVKFEANVPKTPAARSTRKASAATSCAKKEELVQSVYSTRRSTRLLEKCMADLSLKTGETLDNGEKNEDTEPQKKNPAGSETDVIPGRDLSDAMEQWENLKNDSDQIVEHLEVDVDIAVVDTNTEKNKEVMNEDMADKKDSLVHKVDDLEETMVDQADIDAGDSETEQAIQQNDSEPENSRNIDEDNQTGIDAGIAVMVSNTERNMEELNEVKADEKESEYSLVYKDDDQEETMADQTDSEAGDSETKQEVPQNDSEPEKSRNADEDNQTGNDADIAVVEMLIEVKADEEESENSVVQVDAKDETSHANLEEGLKKNVKDDTPLLEYANTESHNDLTLDSLVQVNEQETEQANKEEISELDFVVETMVDQSDSDDDDDTESEPEEDDYGNDSDDTISETDSNQADQIGVDLEVHVDDIAVMDTNSKRNKEEMNEKESENSLVQEEALHANYEEGPKKNDNDDGPLLETHNDLALDSLVQVKEQETEQAIQETMVDQTNSDAIDSETEQAIQQNDSEPDNDSAGDTKTEPEEDDSGDDDLDDTISEADSNQAVLGSDIADEEITLSESEGSTATTDAPKSPPHLEVAKDIITTSAISFQFPRPTKSTTTPSKSSSAMKVVNENKENNMEMMMNENGVKEGEMMKKKKVTMIDEENLKDMSVRQLVKMVKKLSINSNRTALKILPGTNNQTAE